ncbi:MAG: AlpA family phage regulatory protein [Rhodanobacter sp.]|nr:MAG: AlpA family phage regulatory protein [Rhodanobacter sp.]
MHNTHKAPPAPIPKTPTPADRLPVANPPEADRLLRLPQVLPLAGVSKSTWWKLVREGRAPQAVRLGDRCTAWRASEVAAWIERGGQPEPQA